MLVVLSISLLAGCGSKKDKTGKDAFTFEDFRQLFTPASLPYKLTPDSLKTKVADSSVITPDLLQQFLADTLAHVDFPKGTGVRYYPMAYIEGKVVNYFIVKAAGKSATSAYICFFDKKGKYLGRMPAAKIDGKNEQRYFSIDSKQVIKVTNETEISTGRTSVREDFYDVAENGQTSLMMTNSSGEAAAGQVFNPIESLPAKNKLSGDYLSGETGLVSIRDGDDPKSFQFFITFSKEKTGCKGELSGTGHFTGTNRGEYKDHETDCGIAFQFASGKVSIREIGGCGAYRGVRCFFEGSYAKKK